VDRVLPRTDAGPGRGGLLRRAPARRAGPVLTDRRRACRM